MKLYLTRHGQTKWNVEKKFQGSKDSPLTDKGVEAAIALGQKMKDLDIDLVMTSPLPRAERTAKLILGNRKIPIKTDIRLVEMCMGEWEGRNVEDIRAKEEETLYDYWHNIKSFSLKGSDTFFDLYMRCVRLVRELEQRKENILIVSHGMTLAFLIEALQGHDFYDIKTPVHIVQGTSLTIFRQQEHKFFLEVLENMSHLGK